MAHHEGFTIKEELAKGSDDPDMFRWRTLAEFLVDALAEIINV